MKGFRWPRRSSRIVTLGAQGVVCNDDGQVLLVRHGYREGWYFPGGGVERGETAVVALHRELDEEVGVRPILPPALWGIYSHFDAFPGDHIILFVVKSWERARLPLPNTEIVESGFFDTDKLPGATSNGTRRRLLEIAGLSARATTW